MFDFFAHVKTRWQGCALLDLFAREFKGRSRDYYQRAIAAGRLRVEETAMSRRGAKRKAECEAAEAAAGGGAPETEEGRVARLCAQPLRDGQRVRHLVHRHEPPVLQSPVALLAVTEEVVALCKPASMPVHPTARRARPPRSPSRRA